MAETPKYVYLNPVHSLRPKMILKTVPEFTCYNEVIFVEKYMPRKISSQSIIKSSNIFDYMVYLVS